MPLFLCVFDPSKCKPCNSGQRCDQEGLIIPQTCPVGHHCENPSEVTSCLPGTYQDQENSPACKSCEVGHYCPNTAMSKPYSCRIGAYQNQPGQTNCISCPRFTNCVTGKNQINRNFGLTCDFLNVKTPKV